MKISLIGPVFPYRGGIAHFTTLLAKKLIEAEHDVQVISFKKQYPAWLYPGESDKDYSPGREKVDADFILSPLNPFSWVKTVKTIADFQPEEVILPWWVTFWGPAFRYIITRLKRKGFRITVLIHNTLPHEARPLDKILARRALKDADRFIVMTQTEKQRLLELLPTTEKIAIVPLPIYRIFKPITIKKEDLRSQLDLPSVDKPIILFFGFVRPYKGLSDLLKALKIIISQGREVHLIIAGEFWNGRDAYDEEIKHLDLKEYVHIYDRYIPDDEVAQFFEVADLFVAPYMGGTQSGALKTALGFGLPAVVTDVIADELVTSLPDRCKVVKAGEPEALAYSIHEQLQISVLDQDQINLLFEGSWQKMVTATCNSEWRSPRL